jgi:rod shape-determining protein MreD
MRFKRLPLLLLATCLVVIMDVTVFNRLTIYNISFDPVMLFVIAYSFCHGSAGGAIAGFFSGLILDAAVARFVGPWMLLLVIVGYLSSPVYEMAKRRGHLPAWLMVFSISFIAYLIKNLVEIIVYGIDPNIMMLAGMAGSAFLISIFTVFGMKISKLVGAVTRRSDLNGDGKPRWMVAK